MPPQKKQKQFRPMRGRLLDRSKSARKDNQMICRITAREKSALIRYGMDHDMSESQVLRKALTDLLKETYPDFLLPATL